MQRNFTIAVLTATIMSLTLAQQEADLISNKAWTQYLDRDNRPDVEETASKRPSGRTNEPQGWKAVQAYLEQRIDELQAQSDLRDSQIAAAEATIISQGSAIDTAEATIISQGAAIDENAGTIIAYGSAISANRGNISSQGDDIAAAEATIISQGEAIDDLTARIPDESLLVNLASLLPRLSVNYVNDADIVIGNNRIRTAQLQNVLKGETIETEFHVCLKMNDSTAIGQDASMRIQTQGGAIHAQASFSNADMRIADTECASIMWTGTVTSDAKILFDIRNNNANPNEVVIPATYLQVAYKVFDTDI